MKNQNSDTPGRRQFLLTTLTGGAALLTGAAAELEGQTSNTCPSSGSCDALTGQELVNPGELVSGADGFLRGIVTVEQDLRRVTYYNKTASFCRTHLLRAYHGYTDLKALTESKPVTLKGIASPGPTLRAKVGDNVRLTFMNRIDQSCFPETPLTGVGAGCEVTRVNGAEQYPTRVNAGFDAKLPVSPTNPRNFSDRFPDCFRVSNTTNMHFHGTHTTPGGFGDNVLVGVLPNRGITPAAASAYCEQMIAVCRPGDSDPMMWKEMAHGQQKWLAFENWYKAANTRLAKLQPGAVQVNETDFLAGEWPQYWPGYYPYYFPLPAYTPGKAFPAAGQAPGTQWYHAHQHGSTSIQLLNGMAGAFIITSDDYDGKIKSLGAGGSGVAHKPIQEKVMVLQLFAELTNLMTGGGPQSLCVNGQLQPQVSMKPGEVQFWRIVNGSIQSHGVSTYFFMEKSVFDALPNNPPPPAPPTPQNRGVVPGARLIAKDGVQFKWENYVRHAADVDFQLSPANRLDMLVKAPTKAGDYVLIFYPEARFPAPNGGPPPLSDLKNQVILTVHVAGTLEGENTEWYDPAQKTAPSNYPVFPPYLNDIKAEECKINRKVEFSMIRKNTQQPIFMIDGKQFNDGTIDKVMLEGDAEEWLLTNTSLNGVMHPFHIHVNPFQIVEIFDPSTMDVPRKFDADFVWQDTIAIPAGFYKPKSAASVPTDITGYNLIPGHVKIRHRFLDFPGKFVLHCHILGHEDRGMMQLIEVVSNTTVVKHH